MKEQMYFIINNSDGDTMVDMMSESELIHRLDSEYWGDSVEFFEEMPEEMDTNEWRCKTLIIKGSVVFPKPKTVVKTYQI